MKSKLILLIFFTGVFMCNCKKDENLPPIQLISPADNTFIHDTVPIIFKVNINVNILRTEFFVNYELHEAFEGIPEEIYLNINLFEKGSTLNLQLKIISKEGNEYNSSIVTVIISYLTRPLLTAEIISNNSIKLLWQDNSNNIEGYKVKRKEGDNNYFTIGELSLNANEFIDNDIDTSKYYSYMVEVYSNYDAITSNTKVIVFELNKYIPFKEFVVPESVAGKIAICPDAENIVITNYYNDGRLINIESESLYPIPHPNGSLGLAMSKDGSFFITGGREPLNSIIIWELNSLNIIRQINTQTATWTLLTNNENNHVVVSGEPIKIYNITNGNLIKTFSLNANHFIRGLKYNEDESVLLTGGNDDIVKSWDTNSGQVIKSYSGHTGHVGSVCFNDIESQIWSGSYEDNTIRIWNINNLSIYKIINLNSSVVSLINGNEGNIFAATSGGIIYKLDQNGNIIDEIYATDFLFGIDYNKTHDVIAAYGRDSLYKVKLLKRNGHWVITQ